MALLCRHLLASGRVWSVFGHGAGTKGALCSMAAEEAGGGRGVPEPGQTQCLGLWPWPLLPCGEQVLGFGWPVHLLEPGSAC